jgi:hypothetical protein
MLIIEGRENDRSLAITYSANNSGSITRGKSGSVVGSSLRGSTSASSLHSHGGTKRGSLTVNHSDNQAFSVVGYSRVSTTEDTQATKA